MVSGRSHEYLIQFLSLNLFGGCNEYLNKIYHII